MSEPEPAPKPKFFESRSRSGNKTFRLHNTASQKQYLHAHVPVEIVDRSQTTQDCYSFVNIVLGYGTYEQFNYGSFYFGKILFFFLSRKVTF